MIRTKKAGLLTKVVVLALLIYMATALLNLQGQIQEAQAQRDTLSQQVAEQTQINAELAEDVANPDDPDRIADIARDKLGLVGNGEIIFSDVGEKPASCRTRRKQRLYFLRRTNFTVWI